MSVPYAKNMAVEFADKTTKGIKIDGKFETTDITIESVEQRVEAIESSYNLMDNIKDAEGHNRFTIIPITPRQQEGVTYTYAKMILNGRSFRIVIAGSIESSTPTFTIQNDIYNIPVWIWNKIYPARDDGAIMGGSFEIVPNVQRNSITSSLFKSSLEGRLTLYIVNEELSYAKKYFRVEYNLIIE